MGKPTCSIEDCERLASNRRGWCSMHYTRWLKHGDPLIVLHIKRDDEKRFWSKVDRDGPVPEQRPELGPCWLWRGNILRGGYGSIAIKGIHIKAHRFAYELLVGPIPEGLELDHLCRVRHCVNPEHLEPVTHAENVRRGARAQQTHCKRGHEFTPENTRIGKSGARFCLACERLHAKARQAQKGR